MMDSEQQIFLYNLNIHMNGAQENQRSTFRIFSICCHKQSVQTSIVNESNTPRLERADGSVQSLNVQTLTADTLGEGDARLERAYSNSFNFIMANDVKGISDRSLDSAMNEALGNTAVAEASNEEIFRSAA